MWFGEYLLGCLAELRNLCFEGKSLNWVLKHFEVDLALVGHWMEDVVVCN